MENSPEEFESYLSQKAEARKFLEGLERFLKERISPRSEIRQIIEDTVQSAKASTVGRHLAFPEGAFLNLYAVPLIHKYLTTIILLKDADARLALLSESYRHHADIASNSPASKERHPFTKAVGEDLESIVARWWNPDEGSAVSQSCPDLALRFPCPFKVVFEGSIFEEAAQKPQGQTSSETYINAFSILACPECP